MVTISVVKWMTTELKFARHSSLICILLVTLCCPEMVKVNYEYQVTATGQHNLPSASTIIYALLFNLVNKDILKAIY